MSGLEVEFRVGGTWQPVVEDVGFDIAPGETLGLVGESGCGKTVSSLAVMGLIPKANGRIAAGSVFFQGSDLLRIDPEELRQVRGDQISMVFQEPMTSLNPSFTVGDQIALAVRSHRHVSKAEARTRAAEVLDRIGIPDARRRLDDYPHTFSGGMRQRAMIAMALACEPRLFIADEPTTALDVTVQAQILELLRSLKDETGMGMLFVTHDLGVVADICDRVAVMYAGQIVETAPTDGLFAHPGHPYTAGLLASMPQRAVPGHRLAVIPGRVPAAGTMPNGCRFRNRCSWAEAVCEEPVVLVTTGSDRTVRCARHAELALGGTSSAPAETEAPRPVGGEPLLVVEGLRKEFPVTSGLLRRVRGRVKAVDGIDLTVAAGETVGLVGESGSGKSTVARLVLRLVDPSGGKVVVAGRDLAMVCGRAVREAWAEMQMVFQDPYSSLDPRMTIGRSVGEPLEIHLGLRGAQRDKRVATLLNLVGIGPHLAGRLPHEFSGGQRQRIAIARALAVEPKLLVCDEPVSVLDVSTQSQVINLLGDLQNELGLAYLFIAHDLSVVRHISHRIAVMYLGRIVEIGPAEELYRRPTHPYTEALLSAIPIADPVVQRRRKRIVLQGEMPSPLDPPSGCRFRTRCPYAMDICREVDPAPYQTRGGSTTWCHLHTSGPNLAGAPLSAMGPLAGAGGSACTRYGRGGVGPQPSAQDPAKMPAPRSSWRGFRRIPRTPSAQDPAKMRASRPRGRGFGRIPRPGLCHTAAVGLGPHVAEEVGVGVPAGRCRGADYGMDVRSIEDVAPEIEHNGTVPVWWLVRPREMFELTRGGHLELVNEFEVAAGSAVYPHQHPTHEFYYVTSGRGVMTIAEEEREIRQGDLVHIPPDVVHSLRPVSDNAPIHCFCFAVGEPDAGPVDYTTH